MPPACVERRRREGRTRIDFTLNELLQLSWLAHLGFQHMMPNYRDFEIHRFSGETDAREGALAVAKLEAAVPTKARPLARLFGSGQAPAEAGERLVADAKSADGLGGVDFRIPF